MRKIYEVGIDLGDLGTQTIATFDDMALAMAFLDGYKLADATSNVFIDSVTNDFELDEMIRAVHVAMDAIDEDYNNEPNEQTREEYNYWQKQLKRIETLLIEHKS
jgi:hypothetical protein